jgi:FkbM family methyltransferase
MTTDGRSLEARLSLIESRIANLQEMALAGLQRQIIPLDDDFVAIRRSSGWAVAGAEEFRSILHLADGVSGHEPGVQALLKRAVKSGDVVVDVGAHIGLISVELARHVGATGHVILVEPNPRSAEAARRTLVTNGFSDRFSLHVLAAGAEAGRAHYFFGSNSMLGSLVAQDAPQLGRMAVSVSSLDDIVTPGQSISLMKIDAEGWENEVAKGMTRVCRESPDILVVAEFAAAHLARTGVSSQDWFEDFALHGLSDVALIDERTGALSECDIDTLLSMETANILLARPGSPAKAELFKGPGEA